jgi:hypothetical protein
MADLGMELSKLLFAKEPGLLICDMDASARSAAALANLLGCVLATALKTNSLQYERAFKAVMHQVHKSACATADKADQIIPNLTPH